MDFRVQIHSNGIEHLLLSLPIFIINGTENISRHTGIKIRDDALLALLGECTILLELVPLLHPYRYVMGRNGTCEFFWFQGRCHALELWCSGATHTPASSGSRSGWL